MWGQVGIPPGNATTTPTMRAVSFRNVSATGVAGHPGFCMPLGVSEAGLTAVSRSTEPHSLAIFEGLPESPLRAITLDGVRLSGPPSAAAAVQCENATVESERVTVDGKMRRIEC